MVTAVEADIYKDTATRFRARAEKYSLDQVYTNCSGPGGLRLAGFLGDKMNLSPDLRLLDVGCFRGFQTCFLAKEYGVKCVAIDPGRDPAVPGRPYIDYLYNNAIEWDVRERVSGVCASAAAMPFENDCFDVVYATNSLQMIRGAGGRARHRNCLEEIRRVLRMDGLLGVSEPMHAGEPPPSDLYPLVSSGRPSYLDCIVSLDENVAEYRAAGFEIIEASYAPDAPLWWSEFCRHSPLRRQGAGEALFVDVDRGRWLKQGYLVVCNREPSAGSDPAERALSSARGRAV